MARAKKTAMFSLGFGNRLRKIREARGFTQRDLADRVKIELVQISRYERGQALPNAETLVALAEVLQVDIDVLLRGERFATIRPNDEEELDLPLLERFRDLQKLSKRDRDAIILLIDSVLARGDVEQRLKAARSK
jgi:transcriptional regulator with XRE-family HTH domain